MTLSIKILIAATAIMIGGIVLGGLVSGTVGVTVLTIGAAGFITALIVEFK